MSQRTILIIFAVITVVAFAALRLFTATVIYPNGVTAGAIMLVVVFVIGAIAAPYLDR